MVNIIMVLIVIDLIIQVYRYQHTAGKANRQTKNIDEGENFIFCKASDSGFEIVSEHIFWIAESYTTTKQMPGYYCFDNQSYISLGRIAKCPLSLQNVYGVMTLKEKGQPKMAGPWFS